MILVFSSFKSYGNTVPVKSKLPLSRKMRLVYREMHLVSLEKPSKNCKYHYKVSHSPEVQSNMEYAYIYFSVDK